jgi:lipoprotein-releasing system permease protein
VCVLIISLSVITGFEKVIQKKVVDFNSHVIISGFGQKRLPDSRLAENKIKSVIGTEISDVQKFISQKVIYSFRDYADGIEILAFERKDEFLKNSIILGEKSAPDNNEIIIGKKLADKLNISIGDRFTVFLIDTETSTQFNRDFKIKQFIVSGIFETNFAQYDDMKCFIGWETARTFFDMQNQISGYNIKLKNLDQLDFLSEKLQSQLNYPYFVRTIFQQYQNIFTWIDLQKKPIPLILGLIAIVAVFNIIGTILMIILEKFTDIGILISMGTKQADIIKIFLLQGLSLSAIGIIAGNILAAILILLQTQFNIISLPGEIYFLSKVPLEINMKIFAIVSGVTFLFSILSSVIPSYIASKINVIKAVRFN